MNSNNININVGNYFCILTSAGGNFEEEEVISSEEEVSSEGQEEYQEEEEDEEEQPSMEQVAQIINSHQAFKYEAGKEEQSCVICLLKLEKGQMVKGLQCSHKFHSKCINNWLKVKLRCPLCKKKVTLE